jgi:hypothetical protein
MGTALAVALLGLPAVAAEPPGAASPQELVERMKKAAEAEDLPGMAQCLTPKSRGELAKGIYLVTTMVVAFSQMGVEMGAGMAEAMGGEDASAEDKARQQAELEKARGEAAALRDRYNALVGKHGLPTMPAEGEEQAEPSDAELEAAFAKLEHGSFLADAAVFLESLPDSEEGEEEGGAPSPVKIGEGVLAGLAIDGDRATASLDGEPVEFVRIDDRWYFELPEEPGADEPLEP